jgi:hypothetical protein
MARSILVTDNFGEVQLRNIVMHCESDIIEGLEIKSDYFGIIEVPEHHEIHKLSPQEVDNLISSNWNI